MVTRTLLGRLEQESCIKGNDRTMVLTKEMAKPLSLKVSERQEAFAPASKENPYAKGNTTLSTIIRFHRKERLPFLEEALFSLATQYWHDLETIIVIQNGDDAIKREIIKMIDHQPWPTAPRYQIVLVAIPKGMDGRSTLLNRGFKQAAGRYVAFLDDDDVVYQHGYTTLIEQLKEGGAAVAVGGCRMARMQYEDNHWFIKSKDNPFAWGRTRNDLLRDNFVPIHSYVIDRARVDASDLYFDDELPPLEDYDFLLRLCAKYEFDFSRLDTPVCEYRIHNLNSIPYTADAPPEALTTHVRAQQLINERKKQIMCSLPISEVVELQQSLVRYEQEKAALQEQIARYEQERLFEQSRFLNTLTRKIYAFWGRYPRLEMRLSKLTHSGWRAYKRSKARGSS